MKKMNRKFKPTFERPFDNTYISDGGYIKHKSEQLSNIIKEFIEKEMSFKDITIKDDDTKEGT